MAGDQGKPEPVKPEPVKPEPVKPGAAKPDEQVIQSLDFSNDRTHRDDGKWVAGPDYNLRKDEDAARRRIAYSLIGLLAVQIVSLHILLCCSVITVADLKEFSVILGPLVTLVSAATGFYYGTKTTRQ